MAIQGIWFQTFPSALVLTWNNTHSFDAGLYKLCFYCLSRCFFFVGSWGNDDGDGNEDGKKATGLD